MNFRCFEFVLQEAMVSLRRHSLMTLATISTVAISLAVLGGFLLTVNQLHGMAENAPRQFEVHAFLKVETKRPESVGLLAKVKQWPSVAGARLKTREQAWAEYSGAHARADLKGLGIDNPLPDAIIIRLKDTAATEVLTNRLEREGLVDEVRAPRKEIEQLRKLASLVRTVGIAAAILLGLASAAVIGNAIRVTIFARRREIRIMQLVGATNAFIHGPFLCEGIVDGTLGAILACLLVTIGYHYLAGYATSAFGLLTSYMVPPPMVQLYALLFTAGIVMASVGTTASLRRHLRL
jgi:cell division transport system permease protein